MQQIMSIFLSSSSLDSIFFIFLAVSLFSNFVNAEESFKLIAKGIPNTSLSTEQNIMEDTSITEMDLNFSQPNGICKSSSSCQIEIPKDASIPAFFSAPTGTENHITFYVDFFFRDPANEDLTPKKKDLVETYNIYHQTSVTDIQENNENDQVVYYFDGTMSIDNDFQKISKEYTIKGIYKLPERLVEISGTRN